MGVIKHEEERAGGGPLSGPLVDEARGAERGAGAGLEEDLGDHCCGLGLSGPPAGLWGMVGVGFWMATNADC